MKSKKSTFISACLAGNAFAEEIDDFVDAWHDGNDSRDLNEYLGMTKEEYAVWVERPETLQYIIFAHKHDITLEKALDGSGATYSIAARGTVNAKEKEQIVAWLKRTGRIPK